MKWKEPAFGATPMLKALTAANAHRKAQAFDLAAEQKIRKMLIQGNLPIVNGSGTVHGKSYNLQRDFDLTNKHFK